MPLLAPNSPSKSFRAIVGPAGAGALATLLFLALLLKDPLLCWRDDNMLSIIPAFADIARSWNEGTWPLLSPYSWGCGNLAGEYQYGTFSVFVNALVIIIWKFHPSYPTAGVALSAAHIFVLAAGAYLLGKKRGLSAPLATLVALIGALNGWNVCWGATDWFGAIAALAWLPWAWWALEVALDAPRPDWRWLLPAPFVYLLVAGGFPYTVIMLLAVTAWLTLRGWISERRFGVIWPLSIGWILGLGLSAPAWLSLLQYMHGSGRSEGEDMQHFAWVVPWRALPGLVLPSWRVDWPNFLGQPAPHTAIELTGALVPLAALLALVCTRPRLLAAQRTLRWDIGLALVLLVLCLAPSAGVFRWSFRWLPFFHLAFALAGAQALQLLESSTESNGSSADAPHKRRRQVAGWTAWLVIAVNTVQGAIQTDSAGTWARATQLFTLLAVAVWVFLATLPRVSQNFARWLAPAAAATTMLVAYTALTLNPEVPRYPFTGNLANPEPLSRDRLYLSIHRAPYHHYYGDLVPQGFGTVLRLGNTGMFSGVQIINGYSPIHPAGVGRYFALETHGQPDEQRALKALQEEAGPDGVLARIGVDGLLIARDFLLPAGSPDDAQWERAFESPEGTIYHRKGSPIASVRAWESREPNNPAQFAPATVQVRRNARQEVIADIAADPAARKPILLAFRRPFFPGYRATLNGKSFPVTSWHEMLPTVELPPGATGELRLVYRPMPVLIGAVASLATLLVILLVSCWLWKRERQQAR